MNKQKGFNLRIRERVLQNLLINIAPNDIFDDINFSSKKNGGQGALSVRFRGKIDDFGIYKTAFDHGNILEIQEIFEKFHEGRIIYKGIIDQVNAIISENEQYIELKTVGLASILNFGFYRETGNLEFSKTDDPANIFENVITQVSSDYPVITFGGKEFVGTSYKFDFKRNSWKSVLKNLIDTAGNDFYFYIGADGKAYFKKRAITPDFKIIFGREIQKISRNQNSLKIYNKITFFYNSGNITVSDFASILKFGLREKIISNTQITDLSTATAQANKFLNDFKNVKDEITVTLMNNFDYSKILAGDVIKILGITNVAFENNYQVASISVEKDICELKMEDRDELGDEIKKIANSEESF